VFIDRAGAKVGLIEQHSRNSKASLSFVAEQVRPPTELLSWSTMSMSHLVWCAELLAGNAGMKYSTRHILYWHAGDSAG
jgi:hypothetical protein